MTDQTETQTVKLTIQTDLAEAIRADTAPGESVQTRIIKILCLKYGIEPKIKPVGNRAGNPKRPAGD